MVNKKHKFKQKKQTDQAREQLKNLEELPLIGGFLKGLEKFIDVAEKVEEAGGEIRKRGEIKGLGKDVKGIYGFSIKSGIGTRPKVQTFGNIRPTEKKTGKKEYKITETREPIVDVFDEKDSVLIVAEVPGISEEEIETNLKGDIAKQVFTLEAGETDEKGKRKYYKEIALPSKVNAETEEKIYKNGILEIKFKKA